MRLQSQGISGCRAAVSCVEDVICKVKKKSVQTSFSLHRLFFCYAIVSIFTSTSVSIFSPGLYTVFVITASPLFTKTLI